jgi:replication factor A1
LRGLWKKALERRGSRSWDEERLEHLINISHKHDIDPHELLKSFFEAEKGNSAICGSLKIVLRQRDGDHLVFLLTRETEIVSQVSMKNILWENPFKTKRVYSKLVDSVQRFKKAPIQPSSIMELQNGMKKVNLRVKVTEKPEAVIRHSRYNGNRVNLCVLMVADCSGSIRLPLWNEQINTVSVGDEIDIKNARITMFRGLLQIVPSRKEGGLIVVESSKPADAKSS